MRYQETHPWITFELDLNAVDARLWFLLGQAETMCEQIAKTPLRPVTAEELHIVYLVKGVVGTTAIEGNTLSEEEVRAQIEGHLELPPSKEYLGKETDNIINACNDIWDRIQRGNVPLLSKALIKHFNRQVLKDLDNLEEGIIPGEIPKSGVGVGRVYSGAPREDCEYLLDTLTNWLNRESDKIWTEWKNQSRISMAIITAMVAHIYLAWIHPFGDGNGRTARLIEFLILASAGVPTTAAHLLSNFYNETRARYYKELQYASESGGDIFKFMMYATSGLIDGLRAQIERIHKEQLHLAWQSYLQERLGELRPSVATDRKRQLIISISECKEPVMKNEIPDLHPKLARLYSVPGGKVLSRDLNILLTLGLIKKVKGGYSARKEIMMDFVPFRKN